MLESKIKTKDMSSTPYNDLYARCNLQDDGSLPRNESLCESPDIIPYGHARVDPEIFKKNWDQNIGKKMEFFRPNLIYVRAMNLKPGATSGKVFLYFCDDRVMNYPHLWKGNIIRTSCGADSVDLVANSVKDIAVTDDPFNWLPQDPSKHWFLIGRISTDENPNEIPEVINDSFWQYVSKTGGISCRNLTFVDDRGPDYLVDCCYDQRVETGLMHIGIVCQNIPPGVEVAFTCGSPGPNPPINMEKTKITTSPSQEFYVMSTIPRGFKSKITYSMWFNGQKIPSGAIIELIVFCIKSTSNEKLYSLDESVSLKNSDVTFRREVATLVDIRKIRLD